MSESGSELFRWQSFFQHASQPMFLVNRRRRVLFVNRAWESSAGLTLAEVRGHVCRRRSRTSPQEKAEAILSACAPPVDAMEGRACQVRRRIHGSANLWEIQFLPLAGATDLLGILGIVRIIAAPAAAAFSLPDKLMALRDRQRGRYRLDDLGTGSPVMQRLHEQARLAAETRVPITLHGEAGSGKQWLARAIHGRGAQRERAFACFDAERVPAPLLGELLVGANRRIAFGTIYLREPACLPRELQGRLTELLALKETPDFPRLIVGFRLDPRLEIQSGRLLEDIYCATSAVTIAMPLLRERLDELLRLIEIFLDRAGELQPHTVHAVGSEAMNAMRTHPWRGNLAELLEVLRDACRSVKGERIELAELPFYLKQGAMPMERRLPLDSLLEQVERRLIALALKLTQNNQTRAAELLEIWRPRLMRRMEKFGLSAE